MRSPFSFEGRTGRLAYTFGMFVCGVLAPIALICGFVIAIPLVTTGWRFLSITGTLIAAAVAMVWLTLALQARRARDIGWNPAWVVATYLALWFLVPKLTGVHWHALSVSLAAQLIFVAVLASRPGQPFLR